MKSHARVVVVGGGWCTHGGALELHHVQPLGVASAVTFTNYARLGPAIVAAALLLRVLAAVALPLSFDETYYWLWSRHLVASYFDHPPLIAYAIRFGTLLFGQNAFGVRFVALCCSAAAVWARAHS